MTYSPGHKTTTRQKILLAANQLFAANGYEATSIDEIMRACGLTRGGFYAHFSSKGQLYRDALARGRTIDAVLEEFLDGAESVKLSRALSFLAIDIASKTREVRCAYTDAFVSMSDHLLRHSRASAQATESRGLSTAALIVGALAVAQTTDNPEFRARLLASCRENAAALLDGNDRSTPSFFWEPAPN
jgi:TetR/AcrR family transcriptional regulator, transcriptional repressor for nem operon